MNAHAVISKPVIYLAPLQGYTDYSFRMAFCTLFDTPDVAFSPFIETHKPDHRAYRDVLPERNTGIPLVPQVLGNNAAEMQQVIAHLHELGYDEINWNLGCPYSMVTKKQMGAGLLPFPQEIDTVLKELYKNTSLKLSVKMRLGLTSPDEWQEVVPVLNRYPLTEVIIHGRTASQMYNGDVNVTAFHSMTDQLVHPVCYNGNINSLEDFQSLVQQMPMVSKWMIGRGLIANPLLLQEIKTNTKATPPEIKTAINRLHDQLLYHNSMHLSGESHLMHKVKPYWEYFSQSFPDEKKGLKKIKKSSTYAAYLNACREVLS
ncbi:MAG: tRNA-dihydrouridine synthase family protein [Bacteroidales bacterium]|nr:tRNA-dihydrouridine synthase family protein [Bacteroidales bacterium]